MQRARIVMVVVLVIVLAVGTFAVLYYGEVIKVPSPSSTGKTDYFTIVEQDSGPLAGMNGSALKPASGPPWPVMSVHLGDSVVITVMNNKTSFEPHGFEITHYLQVGIALAPGENHTITFVANVAGEFRVFCWIPCAIHPLMQNGLLNITS